jgi:hypothetical protein
LERLSQDQKGISRSEVNRLLPENSSLPTEPLSLSDPSLDDLSECEGVDSLSDVESLWLEVLSLGGVDELGELSLGGVEKLSLGGVEELSLGGVDSLELDSDGLDGSEIEGSLLL